MMIALDRVLNRIKREYLLRSKKLRQRVSMQNDKQKKIVFVVGCQRSGTSMMYKTFDRDPRAQVFDEISKLSSKDKTEGLRLNPLFEVKREFNASPASLVVAKPLVESQNINNILDYFENSKALWMYRRYPDVVNSNLKRFGDDNGLRDIQAILDGDNTNWRSELLSADAREVIIDHAKGASTADAAALFWYARNSLFFQQRLYEDKRLYVCRYETLVTDPAPEIARIYDHFNLGTPGNKLLDGISARSVGKGAAIKLSPRINQLCEEMLHKLDATQGPQG